MYRYTEKTKISFLRKEYKYLVGWGAGRDEFFLRYNPAMYHLDYMIDINESYHGKIICGVQISDKKVLKELKGKGKICVIIYPNSEYEIIEQMKEYIDDFDVIISRLIDWGGVNCLANSFSTSKEDIIMYHAMKTMGIDEPYYVDIGVCHPVIRNNTYLFYQQGIKQGILIEPNLNMCSLAEIYRPENKIIKAGAGAGKDSVLKYYYHPVSTYMGYNTFDYEVACQRGFGHNYREIPVRNINRILEDNCERMPDILDIDTEGMDFDLLNALNTNKFQFKMICTEVGVREERDAFNHMLSEKGYVHFMDTLENSIYISKNCMGDLMRSDKQ